MLNIFYSIQVAQILHLNLDKNTHISEMYVSESAVA